MFNGIVEGDSAIEMHPTLCNLACMQEGHAHEAMPNHLRSRRGLLLSQRQKL